MGRAIGIEVGPNGDWYVVGRATEISGVRADQEGALVFCLPTEPHTPWWSGGPLQKSQESLSEPTARLLGYALQPRLGDWIGEDCTPTLRRQWRKRFRQDLSEMTGLSSEHFYAVGGTNDVGLPPNLTVYGAISRYRMNRRQR